VHDSLQDSVLVFDLEGRIATSFPRPINNGQTSKEFRFDPDSVDRGLNTVICVRFPTLLIPRLVPEMELSQATCGPEPIRRRPWWQGDRRSMDEAKSSPESKWPGFNSLGHFFAQLGRISI
jgi:hypothetical protein